MTRNRPPESPTEALKLAVEVIGSQSATARLLGVTQGAVSKWLDQGKALPAEHVLKVEAETGISRHSLNPEVFGPAPLTPPPPAPPAIADDDAMVPAR